MLKVLFLLVVALFLTACGGQSEGANDETASEEPQTYRVGVATDRAAEIMNDVSERLVEKENIQIEPIVFSDFVQPNIALADGEIDANAYQYIPYLHDFNTSQDADLITIGYLSVEPMGLWAADGIESIEEVPEGSQVAMINDPINAGNSLIQLEKAGLIEVDDVAGPTPTTDDITSNPKSMEFELLSAGQVPRALGDVELIMSGATIAHEAGYNMEDAIYFEDTSNTSQLFRLNFVTRPELADDEGLQKILDEYQSQATVDYANETGSGTYYPGWTNDDDPTENYFEYAEYAEENQDQ